VSKILKLGIIICDRYRRCAGGKCFRAMKKREGAFSIYKGKGIEIVGYTSCDGCPGGNIEYAIRDFIQKRYEIPVICGTHPIPEKYLLMHKKLGGFDDPKWNDLIGLTLTNEKMRISYN